MGAEGELRCPCGRTGGHAHPSSGQGLRDAHDSCRRLLLAMPGHRQIHPGAAKARGAAATPKEHLPKLSGTGREQASRGRADCGARGGCAPVNPCHCRSACGRAFCQTAVILE